jgi:hypothetical protein
MPASARNRLAVLTATLLLVAGLTTLSVVVGHSPDRPHLTSAAYLHHGVTAPAPVRTMAADLQHSYPIELGLLADVLVACSFGALIRSRTAVTQPAILRAGFRSGRGPPSES